MLKKKFYLLVAVLISFMLASTSVAAIPSQPSDKVGLAKELIYFVFPDRYLNGDTSNDNFPGYKPSDTAFFHGGDLKGLTGTCEAGDNGLARIKNLGFTAVWVTPLVVQQRPTPNGAGYHGYWGVDFLNIDPHLGTKADLIAFSQCAKKLGLKLILDVVTNHTGDVIRGGLGVFGISGGSQRQVCVLGQPSLKPAATTPGGCPFVITLRRRAPR